MSGRTPSPVCSAACCGASSASCARVRRAEPNGDSPCKCNACIACTSMCWDCRRLPTVARGPRERGAIMFMPLSDAGPSHNIATGADAVCAPSDATGLLTRAQWSEDSNWKDNDPCLQVESRRHSQMAEPESGPRGNPRIVPRFMCPGWPVALWRLACASGGQSSYFRLLALYMAASARTMRSSNSSPSSG